tara:strand:- start:782 stop:916 length:135 start_codon:yes stop_codon:yes gene_type:complete
MNPIDINRIADSLERIANALEHLHIEEIEHNHIEGKVHTHEETW